MNPPPVVGTAVDLASRWLGGTVVAASDESFGDKENLLTPGPAAFEPGRYGNRGEIVDGWETRRRRNGGHDWVIVRLGAPGTVASVTVDTSFFTGNFPEHCAVHACGHEGYPGAAELTGPAADWTELVPRSPLGGDRENVFAVTDPRRFTHVRLSVYPDGGVARLRVHGDALPDPRGLEELTVDLLSQRYGGAVVASSDDYFSAAAALNRPGQARSMGEGWETRRRRDTGNDFVVFRLGFPGRVRRLVVDTSYFRYNASESVAAGGGALADLLAGRSPGVPLLPRTRLQPDTRHEFTVDHAEPVAAIRLDAFPDGGLSRVRAIGSIDPQARRVAGHRWFNALPAEQAVTVLVKGGMPAARAAEVVSGRPLLYGGPGPGLHL
ncbi:MAG TPA: allantoicase [Streptosporangiaceae bacterium]|nr:allantoicase [Streptosporangiaceae bacterium]